MKVYDTYSNHADKLYESKSIAWNFTDFVINKLDLKKKIKLENNKKIKSLYLFLRLYLKKILFSNLESLL